MDMGVILDIASVILGFTGIVLSVFMVAIKVIKKRSVEKSTSRKRMGIAKSAYRKRMAMAKDTSRMKKSVFRDSVPLVAVMITASITIVLLSTAVAQERMQNEILSFYRTYTIMNTLTNKTTQERMQNEILSFYQTNIITKTLTNTVIVVETDTNKITQYEHESILIYKVMAFSALFAAIFTAGLLVVGIYKVVFITKGKNKKKET
jgi:hypothetical protein